MYFNKIIPALFSPKFLGETLLERNTSWIFPAMLLSITGGVNALISMVITETLNQYIYFPVSYFLIPLLSAIIALSSIFTTVCVLFFMLSKDQAFINKVIIIVFWASLPLTIRQLVRLVYMLSFGTRIIAPGLSALAPPLSPFSIALEQIDIYLVWFFYNLHQLIPINYEKLNRINFLIVSVLALLIFRMVVKIALIRIDTGYIFILF